MSLAALFGSLGLHSAAHAQDNIMGQIQFIPANNAIKTSGVWIDGQYVGYVGELAGRHRLRLLPGVHDVVVRQAGYTDFNKKAVIEPGLILDITVNPDKDTRFVYPETKSSSLVTLQVQPTRAAVFLDDNFVGHVDEYDGFQRGMLVVPGKHRIKIALPGFKTMETEVDLLPHQKFTLKTELMQGSIEDADPLIRTDASRGIASGSEVARSTK
ncbi:MAG: PEGA domain-containing protein [Acidobacteriia bacterium]|nr:PEGA domain-containing protein [Terriglobia bacterium]